ncbi:Uncharacterized protein YutD [Seinonella peptonophila]|uniref:Uncharacterized protein YutD n=1 Tax=Seinonella peptonophila TaxID=112248 RepID=A0A1M4WL89_9BACL|nr:YutD family protein [Seinonella peptonophila]SHE81823.1 Uncharacterized protein YutD [Seinonella peptonophila]
MEPIELNGKRFRLIRDYRSAWKFDDFKRRYSDILDKYDLIVGDWGYNQLRLKGFFYDDHARATPNTKASHIEEYLNEFCNFDCAYFILERERKETSST